MYKRALVPLDGSTVAETVIPFNLRIAGPLDMEVVLLRVVQEALHNVRKHAGARSVTVDLTVRDDAVRVEVRDDGVGFDGHVPAQGYGLGGMRSRVEQVGGTLAISTAPGAGTTIGTEVPA